MSLSTQLTRGTLALPMLALFGALALAANRPADAQDLLPPAKAAAVAAVAVAQAMPKAEAALTRIIVVDPARRLLIVRDGEGVACHALPRKAMLLAQAPGDLGPIAQRLGEDCRA